MKLTSGKVTVARRSGRALGVRIGTRLTDAAPLVGVLLEQCQ
jgi:hypothetical protein